MEEKDSGSWPSTQNFDTGFMCLFFVFVIAWNYILTMGEVLGLLDDYITQKHIYKKSK